MTQEFEVEEEYLRVFTLGRARVPGSPRGGDVTGVQLVITARDPTSSPVCTHHGGPRPGCQVLPARKDRGARATHASPPPIALIVVQEFRTELHAAEAKDKKFQKRRTVLKKIVANITMGNDSWYTSPPPFER